MFKASISLIYSSFEFIAEDKRFIDDKPHPQKALLSISGVFSDVKDILTKSAQFLKE